MSEVGVSEAVVHLNETKVFVQHNRFVVRDMAKIGGGWRGFRYGNF